MDARTYPGRTGDPRTIVAWLALMVLGVAGVCLASGCTADPPEPALEQASPFRACPAPPDTGAGASPAASSIAPDPQVRRGWAAVTLPCFTGGAPIRLGQVGRPMVVNLWASWCPPCRKELPEFERLARRAGGTVEVLGVITQDRRDAAASLGSDLSITFPMLFDADGELRRHVAPAGIPATLLITAGGELRHVDVSGALTFDELVGLVRQHLGVVIT